MAKKFTFMRATTGEQMLDIYRLRHDVYIKEFKFIKDTGVNVEIDKYDHNSTHFAAYDDDGEIAGTLRIVSNYGNGLPIKEITNIQVSRETLSVAEASRIAVSGRYRRRKNDDDTAGAGDYNANKKQNERRQSPAIALGLFYLAMHWCFKNGIVYLYAILEKKFLRAMRLYGIMFEAIGDPIEYHGLRIPCMGNLFEIDAMLLEKNPDFLMIPCGKGFDTVEYLGSVR